MNTGFNFFADASIQDQKEWNEERRDEKRDGLRRPQDCTERQDGDTVVGLLALDKGYVDHDEEQDNCQQESNLPLRKHERPYGRLDLHDRRFLRLDECCTFKSLEAIATALPPNHLSPNRVAFPCNVLALMELELLLGKAAVATGDALAVEIDEGVDAVVHSVLGLRGERVRPLHDVVEVPILELRIGHLVVLLDDLAEAGVVKLDIRLQVREVDVKVRDTTLEEQSRVVGVVASCRPDRRVGSTLRREAGPPLPGV